MRAQSHPALEMHRIGNDHKASTTLTGGLRLVNQSIGVPNQCAKKNNLRRIDILVLLDLLSENLVWTALLDGCIGVQFTAKFCLPSSQERFVHGHSR